MSKKVISVLVVVLTLSVFTMGVAFAASIPVVSINGTTLSTDKIYTINEGQGISIVASGASKVLYKLGAEETKSVKSSSVNFTVPTTYTNKGAIDLHVCAVANDGTQSQWGSYTIAVLEVPNAPVLSVNGTTLVTNKTYTINEGQEINIVAEGASKVAYKIGTEKTNILNGSSAKLTVPATYTNNGAFDIAVCSVAKDGTQSQWFVYEFAVLEQTAKTTIVPVVEINGTTLVTDKTYKISEGQEISIVANGAKQVAYKIGTEETKRIDGSSVKLTIPATYTNKGALSLAVCSVANDGTQSQWFVYELAAVKETVVTTITPVLSVNGTTLLQDRAYIINQGQEINIVAEGAKKIAVKIANETTKIANSSNAKVVIPANYTNSGILSIQVSTVSADGVQSKWYTYSISVEEQLNVNTVLPVLSTNGIVLKTDKTYKINEGQPLVLFADGASKIAYKIANESEKTYDRENVAITIPATYTGTGELTLSVASVANGVQSQWYVYHIVVEGKSVVNQPTVDVKISNATLNTNSVYTIDEGQIINITTNNASKLYYKIANEGSVEVNNSNVSFVIPARYSNTEPIALSVSAVNADGVQSQWKTFYIDVKKDDNTTEGSVTIKVDEKVLFTNKVYIVDAEQEIDVSVQDAKRIYYKFENSYTESIVGNKGTIEIPEKYTNAGTTTLSVSAILSDGTQTAWKTYYFDVKDTKYSNATILVKVGKTTLNTTTTYILDEGQEIDISATNAKKIAYKIGNSSIVTVNALEDTIVIPEKYTNTGLFELKVATVDANGERSAWKIYDLEIRDGHNNENYPLIILNDEKLNSNLTGLNVSLRTVPLTTKTGNMNFFLLNENIQFNIDFVNAGKEITDDVTIDFVIPEGFSVKFVDKKGAKQVNSNTLRWTLDGMDKGEQGTIPVTLYYTAYPTKNNIAKPYVTIKSGKLTDTSAVINLVSKSATTTIATNHQPFMLGDAGTNTFRPNDAMSRAEVAIMLTRVLDLELVSDYTLTYKDMADIDSPQYSWAKTAIMTVTKNGLMQGYDDGTFKPGAKITKAQLITILARAFNTQDSDVASQAFVIKDEPIKLFNNLSVVYSSYGYEEHWAANYLAQMIRLNILPDFANTIDGNMDLLITRADAAKLFCTVLYRGPAVDITNNDSLTNEFKDVTEKTSNYEYILEATADKHNSKYQKNGWEKITD